MTNSTANIMLFHHFKLATYIVLKKVTKSIIKTIVLEKVSSFDIVKIKSYLSWYNIASSSGDILFA